MIVVVVVVLCPYQLHDFCISKKKKHSFHVCVCVCAYIYLKSHKIVGEQSEVRMIRIKYTQIIITIHSEKQ